MYADPEFQALARLGARADRRGGGRTRATGARERMHAAFRACSEHELAFWESAWRQT